METEIQKGPMFTKLSLPKYAFFLNFNSQLSSIINGTSKKKNQS